MHQAGFVYVHRAPVTQYILKWFVNLLITASATPRATLCALEAACLAPYDSKIGCHFNETMAYGEYANCHRFDQAMFNIVMHTFFDYDYHKFAPDSTEMPNNIRRG